MRQIQKVFCKIKQPKEMCISQEVLFDNGLVNKPLNATNCRLYNYGYQTNMIFKEKMFFWILDYISS